MSTFSLVSITFHLWKSMKCLLCTSSMFKESWNQQYQSDWVLFCGSYLCLLHVFANSLSINYFMCIPHLNVTDLQKYARLAQNEHSCASSQCQAISSLTCSLGTRLGRYYLPGLQLPSAIQAGRNYLPAAPGHSECTSITNSLDQTLVHSQPLLYSNCFVIHEPDHIGSHCIVLLFFFRFVPMEMKGLCVVKHLWAFMESQLEDCST